MPEGHQHDLLLILARDLAMHLATAVYLTDSKGRLVFYNERAEDLLGRPFSDARLDERGVMQGDWNVSDLNDEPLPRKHWPINVAIREERPAHGAVRLTGLDGKRRTIAVTAFPLLGISRELVGTCSIFWEENGAA